MIIASIRKLAPHIGISHTMLNRHLKKGRIAPEPAGGFDVEKVKASLALNRDVSHAPKAYQPGQAKPAHHHAELSTEPVAAAPSHGPDESHASYNRSKALREDLRVRREELDYRKRAGELLSTEDVKLAVSGMISATRSALLLLPAKLGPRVSSVTDARECEAIIDKEVRQALTRLAEYRPAA